MKICMPTEGNCGVKERLFSHFGSAGYFTIYDTETKECSFIEMNQQAQSKGHGTCQPVGLIARLNVDAVLTQGMGRRAVDAFNQCNIKVYMMNGSTVEEAARLFEEGKLVEMTPAMGCQGHHGHGGGCD